MSLQIRLEPEKVCVAVSFALAEITEWETELSSGVCVCACVCVCLGFFFFLSWTLTPGSPRSPTNGERLPRFPSFFPVRWNTADRLPYHYHIISITLRQHSLARCLQMCYQLIERFNPQPAQCLPPPPPPPPCTCEVCFPSALSRCNWGRALDLLAKWNHTNASRSCRARLSYTFIELRLWNLIARHPIQNF